MIIIGTDNNNMKDFEKTGYKLLPFNPKPILFQAEKEYVFPESREEDFMPKDLSEFYKKKGYKK